MSLLRPRPLTLNGLVLLLIGVGLFAVADGFSMGVLEEDRANYGRVTGGVVIERLSSTGEAATRRIGRAGFHLDVRTSGFDPYSTAVRWLVTGSFSAFVVDYRFGCGTGTGTCYGRDFVSHDLWARLRAGMPVNVRQPAGAKATARLDENPQFRAALTRIAFGCVLLIGAGLLSGRLRLRPVARYLKAPAVVTAIQEVQYGDEKRWRVTFRYFDENAEAQESVDEANDPAWQVGEACVAVYRPQAPDLATLQPLATHGQSA